MDFIRKINRKNGLIKSFTAFKIETNYLLNTKDYIKLNSNFLLLYFYTEYMKTSVFFSYNYI